MIEFHIPAMTCNHCVKTVTETAHRIDPQAQVQVDLPSHTVRIESQQPAPAFSAALAAEGYTPR